MPDTSSALADAAEQVLVGLGLPGPEAGAGPGAAGAALLAVAAVVGAELVLEVERLVAALCVVVAEDVVRAGDHAAGAAGAQPGGDDLVVELLPLGRPAPGGQHVGGRHRERHPRRPRGPRLRSRPCAASYGLAPACDDPEVPPPRPLRASVRRGRRSSSSERTAPRPGSPPPPWRRTSSGWPTRDGTVLISIEGGRDAQPQVHALHRRVIGTGLPTRVLEDRHPAVTPLPEGVTRLMAFAHAGRVDLLSDVLAPGQRWPTSVTSRARRRSCTRPTGERGTRC